MKKKHFFHKQWSLYFRKYIELNEAKEVFHEPANEQVLVLPSRNLLLILESRIVKSLDLNVGPGKFGKKTKHRAFNKRRP